MGQLYGRKGCPDLLYLSDQHAIVENCYVLHLVDAIKKASYLGVCQIPLHPTFAFFDSLPADQQNFKTWKITFHWTESSGIIQHSLSLDCDNTYIF